MITLTLAEIAAELNAELKPFAPVTSDGTVNGSVESDSRLVREGSIFFALHGEVSDGHRHAAEAVNAGAVLLIVDHYLDLPVSQVIVPDTLQALADLARAVVARVRATGSLTVIGITGSNGKTTTKNMLRAVLTGVGATIAPPGSFNNQVGAPLSMLAVTEETKFLIVEMGASAVGAIARTVAIAVPDISVVLKVGLAHAGEFGGIEQTARAKAEIVTALPGEAVAILNADDTRVAAMADLTAARVTWFGLVGYPGDPIPTVAADDLRATASGTVFTLIIAGTSRPVNLQILGEHHVMNALATLAVAHELDIDLDAAITALQAVPRAERWRMEVLTRDDGITVINDAYNASPDSMAAALKTLAQIVLPGQRSIAVLGEMAELGELAREEHDRIGRLVVRLNINKLIVVGHAARHISSAAGLEGSWDGEAVFVHTLEEAQALLESDLRPGDVILVKSSKSANLRFLGDVLGQRDGAELTRRELPSDGTPA